MSSTTHDNADRATVLELTKSAARLYAVYLSKYTEQSRKQFCRCAAIDCVCESDRLNMQLYQQNQAVNAQELYSVFIATRDNHIQEIASRSQQEEEQ